MIRKINNNQSNRRRVAESLQPLEDFECDALVLQMEKLINMANHVIDELNDYKTDITFAKEYDANDVNYAIKNTLQSLDNCSTYLSYLRTALR